MKKKYLLLITSIFLLWGVGDTYAQLWVSGGTNAFLQGKYLEIGELPNGAFGVNSSPVPPAVPTVYHPHSGGTTWSPGGALAEVYDWGHDGWSVGAPNFMGDYTYPGTPFEGWELQIGTGRSQAFQSAGSGYIVGGTGAGLTGSVTSYSNVGGRATSNWVGSASAGGLQMSQETRVDTLASAVVVTTVFRNTSGATIPGVYYMRSCDPDNDVSWAGGAFTTTNMVTHQNEDARHRVMVRAIGGGYPAGADYIALATKDCRAKAFIYNAWPLSSTVDLSTTWTGTYAGATYTLGTATPGDIAIGLTYNLGNIASGDSAIISYAYVFNGDNGIDSAFPDPQIIINGIPHAVVPPPTPNYDTFNVCLYPGMTSLPVSIRYADDKCWSWSHWTWSPGTGLAATTGVVNTINTTVLPPSITYTITGTDSATGMTSCNHKVFYLTITTCNGALCNSPCEGDTLWFNAPGDSTGATYSWSGPAPSTTVFSTIQHPFIYPATAANNGVYRVIKTVAGTNDTAFCTATIHHKPNVVAASNAPLCAGMTNTLTLTATCDSPGVTYSWTAPPHPFTSALQNPTIPGFGVADTGWYKVVVTSVFGCKDTDMTHVILSAVPPPPIVTAHTPYCQFDAFIPFTVAGLVPGGSALWYTSATGGVGSPVTPVINTSAIGTTTIWFSQIIGSCEGGRDSVKVLVNPVPGPIAGTMGVCQYFTTSLTDPTPGGAWSASGGSPTIATIDAGGTVTGVNGGTANITYTLPTSCYVSDVVTIYPKPAPPTLAPVSICQYKLAVPLAATGTNLIWYGLGTTPGSVIPPTPVTDSVGTFNYYVTQTSVFGCVSDSALYPFVVKAEPTPPRTADLTYCQLVNAPALTAIGSNLLWYTSSTSVTGSATAPVPNTNNVGSTTFYVSQTVNQCESHMAPLSVTILYLPQFTIDTRDWICQFDSMSFSYNGPVLTQDAYHWILPNGASFVGGTHEIDKNVMIRFDSTWGNHYVYLTASDYNGQCATTDSTRIKVVPAPDASAYISANVCQGDSITLALAHVSSGAATFNWYVDNIPFLSSTHVNIISHNANPGGPFLISWSDSGRHIIRVEGFTQEGCKAMPTNDTVDVHVKPVATYKFVTTSTRLCIEDSVQFIATHNDYACSYQWEPEHFFDNNNKPVIWGRLEQSNSVVKLTVTDPFGCVGTYSQQINPDACCTVWFPNAFTPGSANHTNNVFRPVFAGFHSFHVFRVTNRWGQTIFESANTNPEWNGTYNDVPQDVGTYYYYIKYDCGGKVIEQKGDITLVR